MDLGEVGLLLVTRGEEEARRAIEDYVRASDNATRSLEENAQRLVRAEEARERSIQRQIRTQSELVKEAASLRKSYEDLSASFSKMDKATLDYYRTEEMLRKGMDAGVVTGTEYARVMELVQQRLVEAAGAIRSQDEEARIALQERSNAELMKAKASYDSIVGSVDKVHAANVRLAESQKKINDAYELGAISHGEYTHGLKMIQEQYDKDNPSERLRALDDEKRKQAEVTAEKERFTKAYDRLNASINPAIRAQQQYDSAIATLDGSLGHGIISIDQYRRAVADLQVTMERSGHTVNQFGQVMSRSERDIAKFARGGMQSLGYQVGDFAVQVQGGTSAIVAFGQQGAQLAGVFGATGALVGAGIAIVSALAHAYVVAQGEAKSLTQTVSDMESSFNKLNGTIDTLVSNDFASTFGDMSSQIKDMTEAALALDNAMSLKNMIDTLDKLKSDHVDAGTLQTMESFFLAFGGMGAGRGVAGGMGSVDASALQKEMIAQSQAENFNELGFDMGYETYLGYQDAIKSAAESGDLAGVTSLLTEMFVDAAPDIESAQRIIASGGYDMLSVYRQLALAVAEANAKMEESRKNREKEQLAASREPAIEQYRAYQKSIDQDRMADEGLIITARQQGIEEYRAYQKSIDQDRMADEMLVATARQQAIEQYHAYQKSIDQDRIADEGIIAEARKRADDEAQARYRAHMSDQMSDDRLIAVAKQAATDRAQASYRAFNQDRIADESLIQEALVKTLMDAYRAGEDLTKLDLPSGIDAAAVVAAELARQLGISLATAQMIVGLGKGATSEIVYDPRDPNYDPQKAKLGRTAAIMAGAPVYYPPPPTSSGVDTGSGTGSGGGAARDPMADLRKQLELEREMLTLTKEQRRVYQALGDERSNYSEMEIDAMAAEIAALERKKQAIADVQSVSDTMQSALSDGFMSMVDGTATVEDAFRSMAQSIIKQLYEVMVVQRLVGQYDAASKTGTGLVGALMKGIAGIVSPQVAPAVSQAYGGAWSGGSPVTAYANGGVVNSPTMFGMSGGRRGLMGEAGPEAILPLKRTSSGKLGVAVAGGGTNTVTEHVNISNVFNVTGSDADTVRREIEKALPRISEVTKASVLDARRRGGKMMATFG